MINTPILTVYDLQGREIPIPALRGPAGPSGSIGPQGKQGVPGKTGEKGEKGEIGANGQSAYEIAKKNGFSGSEKQWLDSLVGPIGPQGLAGGIGPTGPSGPPGNIGPKGDDGYTPLKGIDYFTEQDKNEFIQLVLQAMPDGDIIKYGDGVRY